MASWREVAAQVLEQPAPAALPVQRYGLDAELYAHLGRLKGLPPPDQIARAKNWDAVVHDALSLARDGWAAHALALGWSWHDLFGVGPADSWQFEGLAIWLAGRSLRVLDEARAITAESGSHDVFVRGGMGHGTHPTVTPVLLWDWGRR